MSKRYENVGITCYTMISGASMKTGFVHSPYLVYYEGHFESSLLGIITPQCVDKMLLNNTFLETRIQRLLDGIIFVEKGLGVHVLCMLKISRVYTLAEILSKIFVKKGKLGTLIMIMV